MSHEGIIGGGSGAPLDDRDRLHVLHREGRSRLDEARRSDAAARDRDMTPAVGTPASPGPWDRAAPGDGVAFHARDWDDARWSFLYGRDTDYAHDRAAPRADVAGAARQARSGPPPRDLRGPFIHGPVWEWEVPLYFWFGGMAAGAAWVALGCDLAGDARSARAARLVALGGLAPCPPLLIADLGRPLRFFNMLRIVKPRSPMSTGSWCLSAFGSLIAAAVAADLVGRRAAARRLGAGTAVTGTYLASYTGVLLAGTAVPVWARSRALIPPLFVCTAAATGAGATRLALAAGGAEPEHPVRRVLALVESLAMSGELVLSTAGEARLGRIGRALAEGRAGRLFRGARLASRAGLALRALPSRVTRRADHLPSVLFMLAALAYRFAWLEAGRASADDPEAVALAGRRDQRRLPAADRA